MRLFFKNSSKHNGDCPGLFLRSSSFFQIHKTWQVVLPVLTDRFRA